MKTVTALRRVIEEIAQKYGIDLDKPGAYLRLELPGNGQLVIENIGAQRVSVTNYIEVGTDLVADPQIVLHTRYAVTCKTDDEPGFGWAPVEINELFGGWRLYAEMDPDGRLVLHDAVGQAQLAELCDRIVARNLQRFGWLHLARRADDAPKPWSSEEIYARDIRVDEMSEFDREV